MRSHKLRMNSALVAPSRTRLLVVPAHHVPRSSWPEALVDGVYFLVGEYRARNPAPPYPRERMLVTCDDAAVECDMSGPNELECRLHKCLLRPRDDGWTVFFNDVFVATAFAATGMGAVDTAVHVMTTNQFAAAYLCPSVSPKYVEIRRDALQSAMFYLDGKQ